MSAPALSSAKFFGFSVLTHFLSYVLLLVFSMLVAFAGFKGHLALSPSLGLLLFFNLCGATGLQHMALQRNGQYAEGAYAHKVGLYHSLLFAGCALLAVLSSPSLAPLPSTLAIAGALLLVLIIFVPLAYCSTRCELWVARKAHQVIHKNLTSNASGV